MSTTEQQTQPKQSVTHLQSDIGTNPNMQTLHVYIMAQPTNITTEGAVSPRAAPPKNHIALRHNHSTRI